MNTSRLQGLPTPYTSTVNRQKIETSLEAELPISVPTRLELEGQKPLNFFSIFAILYLTKLLMTKHHLL